MLSLHKWTFLSLFHSLGTSKFLCCFWGSAFSVWSILQLSHQSDTEWSNAATAAGSGEKLVHNIVCYGWFCFGILSVFWTEFLSSRLGFYWLLIIYFFSPYPKWPFCFLLPSPLLNVLCSVTCRHPSHGLLAVCLEFICMYSWFGLVSQAFLIFRTCAFIFCRVVSLTLFLFQMPTSLSQWHLHRYISISACLNVFEE